MNRDEKIEHLIAEGIDQVASLLADATERYGADRAAAVTMAVLAGDKAAFARAIA